MVLRIRLTLAGSTDKVTKVTKEQLKAENFTDDSVKKVNYDNLTVEQLGSKVTIRVIT